MEKHTSNESYGWEESHSHAFNRPILFQIREVSVMVSFIYGILILSYFQDYYEPHHLEFIILFIALTNMYVESHEFKWWLQKQCFNGFKHWDNT